MDTSLQDCVGSTDEVEKRHLEGRIHAVIHQVSTLLRKQQIFHLGFFALSFLLLLSFISSIALHQKPMVSAILIGTFFLSVFSYLILRVYAKLRLPEELIKIFSGYQEEYKEELVSCAPSSLAGTLSEALLYLIEGVDLFFKGSKRSMLFHFLHWKSRIALLELLFCASIKHRIQSIWEEPSSSLNHARFGNLLFAYANLYVPFEKTHIWNDRFYKSMSLKREELLKRSLEEYQIAIKLKPGQGELYLAISKIFDQLGDVEAKIEAFEKYQFHFNDETEILYELGTLYFENGKILKGLEILEELKSRNEAHALDLWQKAKSYSLKCELFSNPEF